MVGEKMTITFKSGRVMQKRVAMECGGAVTGEIAAALNKQGITITSSHVAAIRAKISKTGTARRESKNGGTVTLDTPQVSKTQAVRDYLKTHRGPTPSEIVAAMAKQGIKMSRSHAANIKTTISKEVAKKPDAVVRPIVSRTTFTKPSASSVPTRMIFRPSVSFTQVKPHKLQVQPRPVPVHAGSYSGLKPATAIFHALTSRTVIVPPWLNRQTPTSPAA